MQIFPGVCSTGSCARASISVTANRVSSTAAGAGKFPHKRGMAALPPHAPMTKPGGYSVSASHGVGTGPTSEACTSLPPSSSRGKAHSPYKTLEEEFRKRKPRSGPPCFLSPHPKTQPCRSVPTNSYSTSFSLALMDEGTVSHWQNRGWLRLPTQGLNSKTSAVRIQPVIFSPPRARQHRKKRGTGRQRA